MDEKIYLAYWAEKYKADLTEDIMPFWLKTDWKTDRIQ